ncbi:hypothetical protein ACJROX_26095 [Pseudalkalibacillus sp. A8]
MKRGSSCLRQTLYTAIQCCITKDRNQKLRTSNFFFNI